jgi:hypothetical protein
MYQAAGEALTSTDSYFGVASAERERPTHPFRSRVNPVTIVVFHRRNLAF